MGSGAPAGACSPGRGVAGSEHVQIAAPHARGRRLPRGAVGTQAGRQPGQDFGPQAALLEAKATRVHVRGAGQGAGQQRARAS